MLDVTCLLLLSFVYTSGKWNFLWDACDSSCGIKKPLNFPSGASASHLFFNNTFHHSLCILFRPATQYD